MSTSPTGLRGRQIKADQATLLVSPDETAHNYFVISNSLSGLVLKTAVEALDYKISELVDIIEDHENRITTLEGRGTLAVLTSGNQVQYFANGYISDLMPVPPITGLSGSITESLCAGDLWFDTADNVIKQYTDTGWVIKGAAYL